MEGGLDPVKRHRFPGLGSGEAPLWWAGLSFLLGMGLASTGRVPTSIWIALAGLGWAVALAWRWRRGTALGLWMGLAGAGGLCWLVDLEERQKGAIRALYEAGVFHAEEPVALEGRLEREPELAPDRIHLLLEVERATSERRAFPVQGRVRLIVPVRDAVTRREYDALGLVYGDRLRVLARLRLRWGYRNPGAPPLGEILEGRGIVATGTVKSPLLLERQGRGPRSEVMAWLWHGRAEGIRVLLREVEQPAAGLLVASLFGNRYFLSRQAAEAFRDGGTFHLLVISGAHVAILAMLVWKGLGWLIPGQKTRLGIGLVLVWGYAGMVGAEPPVLRAVLMLSIHLIGRELARSHSGANGLGAAALGMLAWEPQGLYDPGFQLSFLAVAAIVVWVVPLGERLRAIGEWQPAVSTPFPPHAPRLLRWGAEILFWNGARFLREMRRERIRYCLPKARTATWLSRRRLQPVLRAIGLGLLSTTLIQIALLPLMIDRFHRVSLLSPAINLVESALITLLMVGGALEVALHTLLGVGGEGRGWCSQTGLARLLGELGDWAVRLGETMARWPGGRHRPPGIPGIEDGLFLLFGMALLVLLAILHRWNPLGPPQGAEERRRSQHSAGLVVGASLLLVSIPLLFLLPLVPHARPVGRLSLTFLDVGQGDAILASFPDRHLVLIDSGGDARPGQIPGLPEAEAEGTFEEDQPGIAEMALMPFLWSQGVRHLDRIVGTHDHEDHIGGFATLVRHFSVGEAWQGDGREGVKGREEGRFQEMVGDADIPLRRLRTGDNFEIGGVRVEALFVADARKFRSPNDRSLVLRLTFGKHRFLLPGDIEAGAEAALLAAGLDPAAEVLKVAHHGSRTSSTAPFLDRVGAQIAIVSAGSPSPFGHPHPEVLDRLHQRGVRVYRTSTCGAITLTTDGEDLTVETMVPCDPTP